MKIYLALFSLALGLAAGASAVEPQPPTVESLAAEIQDLTDELRSAQDQIKNLESRLGTVEQRLGDSFQPVSPFNTIERRLDDIEDDLKRR